MTEVSLQAYQVLDEIKQDQIYVELRSLNKIIETTYKDEIIAFNRAKQHYDQIMGEGGAYHPDYKAATQRLSLTKKALYDTNHMKKYVVLERQLQTMLNTFLTDLTRVISPHIKTPDIFGIIKKGGSCHVR